MTSPTNIRNLCTTTESLTDMSGATSHPRKGKTMKRAIMFGVAALTAFGFASMGCFNDNTLGSGGNGGKSGSGGSAGASSGGASGGSSTASSSGGSNGGSRGSGGAASGGASGGSSTASSSGGSGGSTTSSGACDTTDGTYEENTTFETEGATDPYKLNKWGTWGNGPEPTVTQTTTGPSGLDCSSGCATLTINFSDGTKQYSAGSFVEYFGTTTDAVENLLNETITAKIAVGVEQASGANTAVPIDINLIGQDTYASTSGVDNEWVDSLGSASSLDAGSGWHTVTFKVTDTKVPSWSPTRTVCASGIHAIGIVIQNNAVIDGTNGAVVTLYVQSVSVGSGGSSGGSGGAGGASSGGSGGNGGGGKGGAGGASSGSNGGAGGTSSGSNGGAGGASSGSNGGSGGSSGSSGGAGGASSGSNDGSGGGAGGASSGSGGGSGGAGGNSSSSASGGSTTTASTGGSTGSSGACGTTDGSYKEDTTFGTEGSTAPYNPNKWGTWGNATVPTLTQTTTGPDGLDCGSGCAMLTIDFSDGTAQYSGGSFVEYFGEATDSVMNLLNETITAKIAVGIAQASDATTDVPISINLFGQDTYVSTNGVDNEWVDDLGSASSLDAAAGWHTVTFKVVDAGVPSWSPTRTVCASALHDMGITIQNTAAIDGTNGAVVTLYIQSVAVSTP